MRISTYIWSLQTFLFDIFKMLYSGFFEPQTSIYVMKNTKTLILLPEFGLLFHTILFSSLSFLISNDQYSISGRLYLIHGETVMEVKGAH